MLLLVFTAAAAVGILGMTHKTVGEINSLGDRQAIIDF
jgi:hypothetical protein